MTILRILYNLGREIKNWDKASQIALAIALILFVLDIIVLATVPELQTQAAIGGVGLMLAIQAIVMWGNRNLVTAFTQAQRLFIVGEFAQAATVLEDHIAEEEHPVIDTLVLLGNIYRNLGKLDASRNILEQALERRADYHFALYAYGKTALAQGEYDTAIMYFQQAIDNDAPDVIAFDLVLAT
ncbi:MAG: tetratricopeptide repeat protein, partial [Chloroflexota bacterium]